MSMIVTETLVTTEEHVRMESVPTTVFAPWGTMELTASIVCSIDNFYFIEANYKMSYSN